MKNLLTRQREFIDTPFDYIYVFIGTDAAENQIVLSLQSVLPNIKIFELNKIYENDKDFQSRFPVEFKKLVTKNQGKNGCVVFDDLMSELAKSSMLLELFTKYAAHSKISTIQVTQNIFHSVKSSTDNTTIYRNIHVLVLFKTPLDASVFKTVILRMGEKLADILPMLNHIVSRHRYVVIRGDFKSHEKLRYTSDIFATKPFPHMRVFFPQKMAPDASQKDVKKAANSSSWRAHLDT